MHAQIIITACLLSSFYIGTVDCCISFLPPANCRIVDTNNTLGLSLLFSCRCLACHQNARLLPNNTCQLCTSPYPRCDICNMTQCIFCQIGSSFNQSEGHHACYDCQTIMVGCSNCDWAVTPYACTGCMAEYFKNGSNICEKCDKYMTSCWSCNTTISCISCYPSFFLNSPSDCKPCSNYILFCFLCTNSSICTLCNAPLTWNATMMMCGSCTDHMPNCNTCISPYACISCDDYYVVNSTAVPNICVSCTNIPHCVNCTSLFTCTQCQSSYFLQNNFFLMTSCLACDSFMEGCNHCQNSSICLGCIQNMTFLYNPINKSCVHCDYYLPACLYCSPNQECYKCYGKKHILNNIAHKCESCSSLMNLCLECISTRVCTKCSFARLAPDLSGCTYIKGCVSVNPLRPAADNCIACDPDDFQLEPQFGKCVCIKDKGRLVGNLCTKDIGCTSTTKVNHQTLCVGCDTNNFVLVNNTCACKQYYELFRVGCRQICGDGYVINLPCDDGNNLDGDGCSSTCQVQVHHQCINDNNIIPARRCQFRGKVGLYLNSIQKEVVPNTAKLTFDIAPFSLKIKQMDFRSLICLQQNSSSINTIQIDGSQLIVTFGYNRSITHAPANMIIEFDHRYVVSPKVNLSFFMDESAGLSLELREQFDFDGSSAMLLFALTLTSLAVFVVGSMAFKMIGVETIYPIQISWVLFSTSKYYKSFFANFKSLSYSYGQIPWANNGEQLNTRFGNLGLTTQLSDSYFLYSLIFSAIFVLYTIGYIYRFKQKYLIQNIAQSKERKLNDHIKQMELLQGRLDKAAKVLGLLYNWMLFPITIGFVLHLFNTLCSSQLSNLSGQTNIMYGCALILGFFATSLVFHSQVGKLHWQQQSRVLKQAQKSLYIPYFLMHNLVLFVLLSAMLIKNSIIYTYYAGIGMVVLHLSYLIVKRPYKSGFSNFSILFDQLAVLFSFFWVLSKGTSFDNLKDTTLFVYGFIGIMLLVNLFGVIRVIIIFKDFISEILARRQEESKMNNKKPQLKGQINFNMVKQNILQNKASKKANLNKLSIQGLQNPFLDRKDSHLNNLLSGTNSKVYIRNPRLKK